MDNKETYQLPITNPRLINDLIPHRKPMIMVDALLSYTSTTAIAQLRISKELIFVENEQLSETGVIEHMAQTVALHSGYGALEKKSKPNEGYIGAIKELSIVRCPKVGELITTEAQILYEAVGMTQVLIHSMVDTIQIATATMTLAVKTEKS